MKTKDELKEIIDDIDFLVINEEDSNHLVIELLILSDSEIEELLYYIIDTKYDDFIESPNLKIFYRNSRISTILDSMRNEMTNEITKEY